MGVAKDFSPSGVLFDTIFIYVCVSVCGCLSELKLKLVFYIFVVGIEIILKEKWNQSGT